MQNVEKFISKSEPKYKLAGLYVMDSIIRMSRHKNGPEKDVYAPRFQKVLFSFFRSKFSTFLEHSTNVQSSRKVTDASPTKRKNEKSYSILAKWQHLPGAHYRNAGSSNRSSFRPRRGFCTNGEFCFLASILTFQKNEPSVKEENPALENELINTILSNPDSEMAKSLSKSKRAILC